MPESEHDFTHASPIVDTDKLLDATDRQIAELQARSDAWQAEGANKGQRRVLIDAADMADQTRNPDKKRTTTFDGVSEARGVYVDTNEKSLEVVRDRQARLSEAAESSKRIGDSLATTATHELQESVIDGRVVDIDVATTTIDSSLVFQSVEAPDGNVQIIGITNELTGDIDHEIIITEREDASIEITFDGEPADEAEIESVEAVLDHIENTPSTTPDQATETASIEDDSDPVSLAAEAMVVGALAQAAVESAESSPDQKTERIVEEKAEQTPEQAINERQKLQVTGVLSQAFKGPAGKPAREMIESIAREQKIDPKELFNRLGTGDITIDRDVMVRFQQLAPTLKSSVWSENPNAPSAIGKAAREARLNLEKLLRGALR